MANVLHPSSEPRWPRAEAARWRGPLAWLARKVGARAAAAGWWIVMVAFDLFLLSLWVGIARNPSWVAAGIGAAITFVVGAPIVHEWPNARRMGRLLVHGG